MRPQILNRDFQRPADDLYQIEVPGEHANRAAGVIQVLDSTAINSIVNRFNQDTDAYERRTGRPYPGMLIDHEHFKHDTSKETRAFGWLLRLENRSGIPLGKIRWTATGQAAVDGGDYRFFSTEYDPADLVTLNAGPPARVRPMRLAGLTLTNEPNNKGGVPITNRAASPMESGNLVDPASGIITTPALDNWFMAVHTVQKGANRLAGTFLDFLAAWELARKVKPDLYAAAFGGAEPGDAQAAAARIASIANRVKATSGASFEVAWNFCRDEVPRLFNRMDSRSRRAGDCVSESTDPLVIRQKAGRLLFRLAQAESARFGNFEFGWNSVVNRERILFELASGERSAGSAFLLKPDLAERLSE